MVKGQARISLHGQKDFLIKLLKESMTLSEMTEVLKGDGVQVSVSSLYRYMLSDLVEEYKEYLWHTGRGLLKSRSSQGRAQGKGQDGARVKVAISKDSAEIKISNQKDFNKFLTNNR